MTFEAGDRHGPATSHMSLAYEQDTDASNSTSSNHNLPLSFNVEASTSGFPDFSSNNNATGSHASAQVMPGSGSSSAFMSPELSSQPGSSPPLGADTTSPGAASSSAAALHPAFNQIQPQASTWPQSESTSASPVLPGSTSASDASNHSSSHSKQDPFHSLHLSFGGPAQVLPSSSEGHPHSATLSVDPSNPLPAAGEQFPQTAPATSLDGTNYFDSRPSGFSRPSQLSHRPSSDPSEASALLHQSSPREGQSATFAETEMTPVSYQQSPAAPMTTSSASYSNPAASERSLHEAHAEDRARGAFTHLERMLAQARPAVLSPTNSSGSSPFSHDQARQLDEAWKAFGDYFLRATSLQDSLATTSQPQHQQYLRKSHGHSQSMDSLADHFSPDDSYESLSSVKGDRKRVLSVEGDAPPPPAKRAEASPPATAVHSRRLTLGSQDRLNLPALAHTKSSPSVTAATAGQALQAATSFPSPSVLSSSSTDSNSRSASFTRSQPAPSLPTSSTTFSNPLSATPAGSAVAAGLHLPFGSQLKSDQATASTFLPQHAHAPMMPSPLGGPMMVTSSDSEAPNAVPTSAPLDGNVSHQQATHQQNNNSFMPPPAVPSHTMQTSDQSNNLMTSLSPATMTNTGFSQQAQVPRPAYNAMIHSTPSSPQSRVLAGSYFDSTQQDPGAAVMSRQPPNPRLFTNGSLPDLSQIPERSSSGPSAMDADDPSAGFPSSRPGHHGHTKSWGFSEATSLMSGMSPFMDSPSGSPASYSPAPSRRSSRPRANTFGGGASFTPSRPPSPVERDESYLPAGVGGEQIPNDLRDQMNDIFVNWLQNLCNDLEATDSKGELIHQTLMAKKMQKLDEVGEFRPFKFRIQAFTNRFAEELLARGLSENQVPHKLVRVFLWNQPLISRYNEEGKKAKSKGNHVWSIDARRVSEGQWQFRPFQRRVVAPANRTAKSGLPWVWEARIWDPQVPTIKANYSSSNLPPWLSWKQAEGSDTVSELSGTPPPSVPGQPEEIVFPIHVVAEYEVQGVPTVSELDFDLAVSIIGGVSAGSVQNSAPHPQQQYNAAMSAPQQVMPSISHPSDPSLASMPAPAQQPESRSSTPEMVQPSAPLVQNELIEQPAVIQAFAQKQALDQTQAHAAIQAHLAPTSLLAKESQVYNNGEGPLTQALSARDNAVSALNYAAQSQTTPPHVISDLSARAQHADQVAKQVMAETQNNALQALMMNGPPSVVPMVSPDSSVYHNQQMSL